MLLATLTSYIVPLCTWLTGQYQHQPQLQQEGHYRGDHDSSTTTSSVLTAGAEGRVGGGEPMKLQLRHVHAVSSDAQVVFHDVDEGRYRAWASARASASPSPSHQHPLHFQDQFTTSSVDGDASPHYTLPATRRVKTYRPSSFEALAAARTRSMRFGQSARREEFGWGEDEVEAPDVERREVLLLLAKMANNAYVEPGDPYWYDLGGGWNNTYPFGWEPDADGFRGQVFATEDNSTVVVSIKGTSAGMFGGGGPTARKDKLNDNLLFSCCCARIDWSWTTVCGCYRGGGKCDLNCLEKSLVEESLFYPIGTNLYNNLTYMYPESNIWIIGHSLGGALASLLGSTFGNPVVTFEAPGERLASTRLHLPSPPSLHHVTHVFHTADPIAMGTCNGVLSSCALGGYALETGCHLGKTIVYDTVTHLGWAVDIRTHGIVNVIDKILTQEWPPSVEEGREVPLPKEQVDCVECYSWEFGDFPDPKAKKPKLLD